MSTLYRKYRPQKWSEVVNQNHVKITIQHELERDQIAHAYLFTGPRGVGKTTVARVLAKALNCQKRGQGLSEPCGECPSCQDISAGRSLDLVEIDAASHTGVDNVRENIIAATRVSISQDKYKVFIIDEVHMLSISAFNALLKILEEPPLRVIFILCTTEAHKIPQTIMSRCQKFDFKRISIADIARKLKYIAQEQDIKIGQDILDEIARQSEGHMRDAESLLGQVVAIGGREITRAEADLVIPRSDIGAALDLVEFIAKKDAGSGIGLINKSLDDGVDLKHFLKDTVEILRKILLIKINPRLAASLGLELGESLELRIARVAGVIPLELAVNALIKLSAAMNEAKNSFIAQLPAEIALVELSWAEKKAPAPTSAPVQPGQASAAASSSGPIPPPVPSGAPDRPAVDQAEIMSKWSEVLARVKKHNHSLSFILRVCQPRDLKNNRLCLAFKYKFHRDRVSEQGIKQTVEKVLSEVYGADIMIEALVDESLPVDKSAADPAHEPIQTEADQSRMIDSLLKTFGGKVVG